MINFTHLKKVYFIGIGGIGISAIARLMLLEGKQVAGSDMHESPITNELRKHGATIYIGHRANNLHEADLVVYTIAIPDTNLELRKARTLGITTYSYPEMLGEVSRGKVTVAVAGTHGKTTTTAMLGTILIGAKKDPTVIVGSILKDHGSNLIVGKSNVLVAEACEYRRSFLNLNPHVVVITNIDVDHLDYYTDIKDIQRAFTELVLKLPKEGALVCNPADLLVSPVAERAECRVVDWTRMMPPSVMKVPGEHNKRNAQAAIAAAEVLGVSPAVARGILGTFAGTWRRIERKGRLATGAELYDDYAHAPAEIRATLAALTGEYPGRRIVVVFQPHLYSRTKLLFSEFLESFYDAGEVIITDIYAAREKHDPTISGKMLAEKLKTRIPHAHYMHEFSYIKNYLLNKTTRGDVVVLLGAGSIYQLAEDLML